MFSSQRWERIDAHLGVPLILTPWGVDSVETHASHALQRRCGVAVDEADERSAQALAESFGVGREDTVRTAGGVAVDLASAQAWLRGLELDFSALGAHVSRCQEEGPSVQLAGCRLTWDDYASRIGLDAATWSLLLSASKAEPFVISYSMATLGSRAEVNPLARVRRAHAALTRRLDLADDIDSLGAEEGVRGQAGGKVAVALAVADRAAFDAIRSSRPRPLILAVDGLASAALHYLEHTPVNRTDLCLSGAARTVLADALGAAQVAAPVPY